MRITIRDALGILATVGLGVALVFSLPGDATAEDDLIIAARTGNLALAKKAVRRGSSTTLTDQYGSTPLHLAAQSNSHEIVVFLLAKGAPLEARTKDGYTPLASAASGGSIESARLLLQAGADPAAVTTGEKKVPLVALAALRGSVELTRIIHGAP